jgi:probable HAF family extracellular repeat protein
MKSLGHLTPTLGYGFSEAYAINNYGQIVGSSITASGQEHAFLYSGGKMKDIDTLPGGTDSCAVSINDNGQIVGWSTTASGEIHAFLYSRGKMEDLGTLPGGIWSYATGINNKGQIVGYSDALGVGPGFDGMPEGSHCIYSFLYNSRSSLPGILPLLLGSN